MWGFKKAKPATEATAKPATEAPVKPAKFPRREFMVVDDVAFGLNMADDTLILRIDLRGVDGTIHPMVFDMWYAKTLLAEHHCADAYEFVSHLAVVEIDSASKMSLIEIRPMGDTDAFW